MTALIIAVIVGAGGCSSQQLHPLPASITADSVYKNPAAVQPNVHDAVMEWRAERVAELTSPYNWLSLIGMHWLQQGRQSVGSALASDILLPAGPDSLGFIEVSDAGVMFHAAGNALVTMVDGDDEPVTSLTLIMDPPTKLQLGSLRLYLIDRGGLAIRIKDANSDLRRHFAGLDYYDVDPTWAIEARFEAHPPGQTMEISNVLGQLNPMLNPGQIVFALAGREVRLEAVDETGEGHELFLIFADRTNRYETYGAGRMLYTHWPRGDQVMIDFNRAYNPPCAFTDYSTCPLPPPSNRINAFVRAGEKRYQAE